ncbi:hypothetical protein BCR32DRAFT_298712 [Anaeromyces robustus]|uniref:SH3 domain-containing protein n=1 Tax=Anaeromyces robustus TaxID=1754192 RepID=A0A1Y1UXI1_9FUNG|nr:hypothetical protein BCR32DRAFT_298712 [Anaeromyces robustus]|eukprot:ORX41937.1 hypothetical protein BCR32DRAFT_298712 [Anaeromyces robustus]
MVNSINIIFILAITVFLNFSYASINIKPSLGRYQINDKIAITWNVNKKFNNATLSYRSIKNSFNQIDIKNNIYKQNTYNWEIPKELKNDIGYFVLWNDENEVIEHSDKLVFGEYNEDSVANDVTEKIKRAETSPKTESSASSKGTSSSKPSSSEHDSSESKKEDNDQNKKDEEGDHHHDDDDGGDDDEKSINKTSDVTITDVSENGNNENKGNDGDENDEFSNTTKTSTSVKPLETNIATNKIAEETNKSSIQTKFNEFMNNNKNNIYYIAGGGIVILLILLLIIFKLCGSKNKIPNGKRSIKRFTLHEDAVPPIINYNDSWKNTMNKSKGYNTLPKSNSNDDPEKEQLITGDNLISDAEKFARKHGLTDKEWIARKDYIPYREDELEVYEGNRIKVYELYDDLWCYGMNLDHYGTLSNDNEGMFPSSILPVEIITALLTATNKANANANATEASTTSPSQSTKISNTNTNEEKSKQQSYEINIDCNNSNNQNNVQVSPGQIETHTNNNMSNNVVTTHNGSQFTLPKPLTVPLMPPKPLPVIPNLNRSSSLRSSVHRKRNSNPIDQNKSPLIPGNNNVKRGSQLSNLSNEIEMNSKEVPSNKVNQQQQQQQKQRSSLQNKLLFIGTNNNPKERRSEDAKALLSSPESDYFNKSTDSSVANTPTLPINNNNNVNNVNNLKQNQNQSFVSPVLSNHPGSQSHQSIRSIQSIQSNQSNQANNQNQNQNIILKQKQPYNSPILNNNHPGSQSHQSIHSIQSIQSIQSNQANNQNQNQNQNIILKQKQPYNSPILNNNPGSQSNQSIHSIQSIQSIQSNNTNQNQNQTPISTPISTPITSSTPTSPKERSDDIYQQQQLLIQKQREQLQQQQLEQQKLQERLKQQQLQQQLQQQQIQKQIQQLQQLQQEKERQLQQQKQQLQQQLQQQQIEQQQLRIQREKQQILQKSKLKEIEYEREKLLQASMRQQNEMDSNLPSYSEAVNTSQFYNNFASSSSSATMNDGSSFPLPPTMKSISPVASGFPSPPNNNMSPIVNYDDDENPELYPRNASYSHQKQKRDKAPTDYPRNASRAYVDEHPSIGRKIRQNKESPSSPDKNSSKSKESSKIYYQ